MPQAPDQPLLLFMINPVSGGKTKHEWESSITEYFKDKPFRVEFYLLSKDNDSASIQHYIETLSPQKVIAVGGDGTVKMLAEQLAGKDIPMGILPAGSANGMARELGISNEMTDAMNTIINGEEKQIDVIQIDGKEICLHLSDLGLNAQLVKHYENHSGRGMWSYARFVFKVLWNKQQFKATIKSDAEDRIRDAYMVVLANARMYGTGATINPHGDVSDGVFEIVIIREISVLEAMKMILKIKTLNKYKTEIISVKEVSITSSKPIYFQVDGEYKGKRKELKAKILPGFMKLMVPLPADKKE
jgi:diacylglycerol kinase (ATP)